MRTAYSSGTTRASVDSMMTPMIDVVFLLLVFFLTTSSFQRLEKALPGAVAAAPEPSVKGGNIDQPPPEGLTDLSDIVVKIKKAGDGSGAGIAYSINDEALPNVETLANRLKAILRIRSDAPIVIDPEDSIPSGEAIRVYDIARANGSVSVFLVAR